MESKIGLTASVDVGFDELDKNSGVIPCTISFSDVNPDKKSKASDLQKLMEFCMCHECSDCCLRKKKRKARAPWFLVYKAKPLHN